jgi:hypothetical protein
MRTKGRLVIAALSTVVWTGPAGAQTAPSSRPPEVERMGGYIGDWSFQDTFRAAPGAPQQVLKGTWQARWLGDRQVEWRWRAVSADGEATGVQVEGWDPVKKVSFASWYVSDGSRGTATAQWTGSIAAHDASLFSTQGAATRMRCTMAWGDFTRVEYRCESGEKGKTWVSREGRAVKVVPNTATAVGTGRVLGIHDLVLKPDVAPAEFERFVAEEWAPAFADVYPGVDLQGLKGERGNALGTYLLVFEIDSIKARDHYFPAPGSPTSRGSSTRPAGSGATASSAANELAR